MGKDLGVAPAAEAVSAFDESSSERVVVVELAVLNSPDRLVLVRKGLMASLEVDDVQPPHTERDPGVDEEAAVVWTAMRHHVGHALERLAANDFPGRAAELHDSTD